MDKVKIEWGPNVVALDKVAESNLAHLDESGFYAILSANLVQADDRRWGNFDLLYIGQAYDQTLRERLVQPHDAYSHISAENKKTGKTAVVMVGIITAVSTAKLTQDLVDDIEHCLIYSNQPLCNDANKREYKGRSLQITNSEGCFPLKELSSVPKSQSDKGTRETSG